MPHGDRGKRNRTERIGKGSPTTQGDWTAGTITINYPQDDGTIKSYTYDIPQYILNQAAKNRRIDPIVDYLATYISRQWANRTGADSKAERSQYNNVKLWLWRNMQEQIWSAIQSHSKDENTFLPYYHTDDLRKHKDRLKDLKEDVHPELIEFLGDRKWWFVNYSQIKPKKKPPKMSEHVYRTYKSDIKKYQKVSKELTRLEDQQSLTDSEYRKYKKDLKEHDRLAKKIQRTEEKYEL